MADLPISGFPAASLPLAGTEFIPLVQGGATKKVAQSDIIAGLLINGGALGTPSSGTLTNATGLPAAGVVNTALTLTDTQTATNKRITPRVGTTTSSATPTINTDNVDVYSLTAQAVDITSMTTNLSGTPTNGQALIVQVTGTAPRLITWGSGYEASTIPLPAATVGTEMLTVGFLYNSATSKFRCIGAC